MVCAKRRFRLRLKIGGIINGLFYRVRFRANVDFAMHGMADAPNDNMPGNGAKMLFTIGRGAQARFVGFIGVGLQRHGRMKMRGERVMMLACALH